jgi:hypothetical protein
MRTCFIHVGTHKTGTTSIQATLASHPTELARAGYIYPSTGRSGTSTAHHNTAFQLLSDDRFCEDGGALEELLDAIGKSELDVILSSEEFTRALHFNNADFSKFIYNICGICPRTTLIIYLRRQDSYIRSAYFERLKSGFTLTFEEYAMKRLDFDLREFPLDYSRLLAAADFPGVEMIVRSYDAVRDGLVVSDFLKILGLNPSEFRADATVNVEQPLTATFGQYYQNRMGRLPTEAERQIIDAIIPSFSSSKLRMGEAIRAAVARRFEQSNKDIAMRLGLPELVEGTPSKAETGFAIDPIFSAELPIAVCALAGMKERLDRTDVALAEAQSLAIERFHEIKSLQERLDRTNGSLSEAQSLAIERFHEIAHLRETLNRKDAAEQ